MKRQLKNTDILLEAVCSLSIAHVISIEHVIGRLRVSVHWRVTTWNKQTKSTFSDGTCFSLIITWVIILKQSSPQAWREFVYFAVKICQRDNFPSATLTFMVWKFFGNRQKHQRGRSAWVRQVDFGKLGLNNRNHSENYHHLSLDSKQKICNKIKQRARSA